MTLSFPGTFSKSPLAWGFPSDTYVKQAHGCHLTLNDNITYIDWVSGLGSNILGYGSYNRQWSMKVTHAISLYGGSLSLPHLIEYEVADKLSLILRKNIPYWNSVIPSVRFAKTGSDITTMAIRLARAVTGKPIIVCAKGGYHGWHSWTIGRTQPAHGITRGEIGETVEFDFGDIGSLEKATYKQDIGAIILEHGLSEPKFDFYDQVRKFCNNRKCLLIMDEVVTGLRYGLGGVSGLYNIKPDLVCIGKALGNGLPIAALVGFPEYMDWFSRIDPVFCSSTMWGESISLMAAKGVLDELDENRLDELWRIGEKLIVGLNKAGWETIGDGARSLVKFKSPEEQAFFIHGMRDEGILMNRPNMATLAHGDDELNETLEAARIVRQKYNTTMERGMMGEWSKGKLPRVLFSNR